MIIPCTISPIGGKPSAAGKPCDASIEEADRSSLLATLQAMKFSSGSSSPPAQSSSSSSPCCCCSSALQKMDLFPAAST